MFERLRIKEVFLYKQFAKYANQSSACVDETELMVDTIQQYREAFNLYLEQVTHTHKHLMTDITGGLDPELYRVYHRMLTLNDTCESFISAHTSHNAAETLLSQELEGPTLE